MLFSLLTIFVTIPTYYDFKPAFNLQQKNTRKSKPATTANNFLTFVSQVPRFTVTAEAAG